MALVVKKTPANVGDIRDAGSIPGTGRSPGGVWENILFSLYISSIILFSSVQSLSPVQLFVTPWTAGHQASPSIANSRNLLKFLSIESVMPSNHLIPCHPLLLLLSIFPSIRVFYNVSVLCIRWPKHWSLSFSISPSNDFL